MATRGRQVALVVVALIVAAVCVRLGFWQLGRLHGRQQVNAMLAARAAQPPVTLPGGDPSALAYARVAATGAYDPIHEVVLGQRSLDGIAGNHVLTPLVLDDGTAVLVDRGWVPLDVDTPPVPGAAAAPGGTVHVEGLALPPDAISDPPPSQAPSITTRIDLGIADLPYRLLPVYVLLAGQDPAQATPVPATPPTLDEGSHRSYAFQWFAFATIAIGGCVVLLARERRGPRNIPTPVTR